MNLRSKALSGIAWSMTSQVGKQASQFVITAILARLLAPSDFGLLGMAMVFIGVMTLLNEKGFSGALIQSQEVSEAHYSSIFWLNVFIGALLAGAMVLFSPLIALFYQRPELRDILTCLSVNFVIASFVVVPRALLQKEMDFKKLAAVENLSIVLAGVFGIYLAVMGYGVWSLVFQSILLNLTVTAVLWCLSRWKPGFTFSLRALRGLARFSVNTTASFVLSYAQRNIDYLLIGRFLGAEILGFYALAYKLMSYPIQNISWVVSKVMFPAFSRVQNDLERVRRGYLRITKAISLVTFPIFGGLFALAPEFVRVVYGSKWEPATDLVRIFCFYGVAQSIGTTVGDIILSQGKAGLQLKLDLTYTCLVTLAISVGLIWGIYGVAIVYTCAECLWSPYALWRTNRLIGLAMPAFLAPLGRSLAMTVAMAFLILVLKQAIHFGDIQELMLWTAVGTAAYGFFVWRIEKDFIWRAWKEART